MPITTREPARPSALQRFRAVTEAFLLHRAQREMARRHPSAAVPPAPQRGLVFRLLPFVFLPGFRLTPWAIKRRLLTRFFVRRRQRWPERPWEEGS